MTGCWVDGCTGEARWHLVVHERGRTVSCTCVCSLHFDARRRHHPLDRPVCCHPDGVWTDERCVIPTAADSDDLHAELTRELVAA